MYRCPVCQDERANNEALYIKHLRRFHNNTPNLNIPCFHCPKSFNKLSSRAAHISKVHQGRELNVVEQPGEVIECDPPVLGDNLNVEEIEGDINEFTEDENLLSRRREIEAQFVLSLRAQSNATEELVKSIIENTAILIESCLEEFSHKVRVGLGERGLNLDDYVDVPSTIQSIKVFEEVNTKYKQNAYFQRHVAPIHPKKISLGARIIRGSQPRFGVNRKSVVHNDELLYVSIVEVIQKLLGNKNFQELVSNTRTTPQGVLRSFRDGSCAKSNPLLLQHENCLELLLYYDGARLNDTASSRAVDMGMIYFTLGNIDRKHRSSVKMINLVCAVENEILKHYKMDAILAPIVEDLKKLEKGIPGPNGELVHGTLIAFTGDNLGSHAIGGFKEGFTAAHCCRYCMADLHQVRTMTIEDASLLRTPELHSTQTEALSAAVNNAEFVNLSKNFGINRNSKLNDLQHFHVVTGLPPDPFHDIWEGSLERTIRFLLRNKCVGASKVMSLDAFNARVAEFDYGYSETKPSPILLAHLQVKGTLHQTGSQMWMLGLMIPFILGLFIEVGDPHWRNYLLLLDIMCIVHGDEISVQSVAYLQFLISDYLFSFQQLYRIPLQPQPRDELADEAYEEEEMLEGPPVTLTPKQHYLTHYPTLILRFGPLNQFMTNRMESKHQYFKDMMRRVKSFRNPSLSMTNQSQLYQSYILQGSLIKPEEQGVVKKVSALVVPYRHLLPENCQIVTTVSWVKIFGVKYCPEKCFVILSYNENIPLFGLVVAIIYLENQPRLVCKRYCAEEHDTHLNGYRISCLNDYIIRSVESLHHHTVCHSHIVDGHPYMYLRRAMGDIH